MKTIKICDNHEKQVPLIWTFAFAGAEYWCPCCGYIGGMFGAGKNVDEIKELKQLLKEYKRKTKVFLDAKSTLACSAKKIKGNWVERKDIPIKIIDKAKKIVESYQYEL